MPGPARDRRLAPPGRGDEWSGCGNLHRGVCTLPQPCKPDWDVRGEIAFVGQSIRLDGFSRGKPVDIALPANAA
jgi:hypothetical protein